MIICDFCKYYRQDAQCHLGLKIPKAMSCREFGPALESFCSDPKDFVSPAQLVQMATFFGMKGSELKKVGAMAAREEGARPKPSPQLNRARGDGGGDTPEPPRADRAVGE
ncbi:MAG TPA: hypothetical protein VF668_01545 [Pyrinomonadaceae bacterium]